MKAIIVAGGHGSRLYPMTKFTHKTLLPLCGRPIIDYVISTIRHAGINEITIIDDTYNANLMSTLAALEYLNAFSNDGRKIFVFADMLELGKESKRQHVEVGKKCSFLNIDIVYTFGEQTIFTNSILNSDDGTYQHFESSGVNF